MRTCFLNNYYMKNERNSRQYQAIMIDLALAGVIDKSVAEQLLGYEIPSSIVSPVTVSTEKTPKKKTQKKESDETSE